MQAATKDTKTYADYAALEEGAPYQLIDGEFVLSPAPTLRHQRVVWSLGTALRNFVTAHDLGLVVGAPVDVYFSETETFQPDLVFISHARRACIKEPKIDGAPDLVAEVLSPSTGYYDLTHKRHVYETAGVTEYWIIDPMERTVEVLALAGGAYTRLAHRRGTGRVDSRLLDGFAVDLETLFTD